MYKHPRITQERLQHALQKRIRPLIYSCGPALEIQATVLEGEPLAWDKVKKRPFTPFAPETPWGRPWETTWFRFSGTIPAAWAGLEVVALIDLGAVPHVSEGFTVEGQVWQDGVPTRALNVNRRDVPVTTSARAGEAFEFYVEAAANPHDPEVALFHDPAAAPRFKLRQAQLAIFNREMWNYCQDFRLALGALEAIPNLFPKAAGWMPSVPPPANSDFPSDPRRGQLLYALNESVNLFDEQDPSSVARARAALKGVLAKKNGDTVHRISAVGHAHIDTAWLWPLRETIRKCARTFSTALRYQAEYPGYVFACSQAQQYAWIKALYPSIYADIKKAVASGQWEPIGGMWVEPDCNLPSGESLVRQIVHGKRFFRDEFGLDVRNAWIPDVFGYSAALPQIYRLTGIDSFLTQKISWSQFTRFPHHTFLWEGIDGTRIFTHFPPADTYNAVMEPKELLYSQHNFKDHDRATRSLYVYGYGDGGGGPTRDMLEAGARLKNFEGLPAVELETVASFFEKAKADARDLPVWVGELYLEKHRGTYTTQAATKQGNRRGEFLLRAAEMFDAWSFSLGAPETLSAPEPARAVYDVTVAPTGTPPKMARLDRAWKLLLLNQFHDIIPGSSIQWVYEDNAKDYAAITALAAPVADQSLAFLLAQIDTGKVREPLVLVNSLGHTRREVVDIEGRGLSLVEVPPLGYTLVDRAELPPLPAGVHPVKVEANAFDNGILRVEWAEDGQISRIHDHRAGREVLAPGEMANRLELHKDFPPIFDAWEVEIFDRETSEALTALESLEVAESGPLRAVLRVVRRFGRSTLTQRIVLMAGSPRLDFETEVDWHEDNRLLRVAFPVRIHADHATYEVQYGHLRRPAHFNTDADLGRFEVCAQKWADLSEGGYGVALLNDSKYGYDIHGHTLALSLLRAPKSPDPTADRGLHRFTYSLLPHAGDFRAAGVIEEAYALNEPLRQAAIKPSKGKLPAKHSFFSLEGEGVVVEAVKRADDGRALVVRLYEAHGNHSRCKLATTLPVRRAQRADLLEHAGEECVLSGGAVTLELRPFEIVTLRFEV